MRDMLLNATKAAGIATLYGVLGYMPCRTVNVCGWEPFLHWYDGDNVDAATLFHYYIAKLLEIVTVFVAFLAGRSYRPFFHIEGVAAGTAAVLIFRLYERKQWARPDSFDYTFFEAAFLGALFGLLGTVSGRSKGSAEKAIRP